MITTTPETILAVEALFALPYVILGLSHILQPKMWLDVFERLAAKGHAGVIERTFLFELWPAMLIVVFHQDWSWPGLLVTVYAHVLTAKIAESLLFPDVGVKSLTMAQSRGKKAFVPAGVFLCAVGLFCCARALGLWP